jgi:hypothetical protein
VRSFVLFRRLLIRSAFCFRFSSLAPKFARPLHRAYRPAVSSFISIHIVAQFTSAAPTYQRPRVRGGKERERTVSDTVFDTASEAGVVPERVTAPAPRMVPRKNRVQVGQGVHFACIVGCSCSGSDKGDGVGGGVNWWRRWWWW